MVAARTLSLQRSARKFSSNLIILLFKNSFMDPHKTEGLYNDNDKPIKSLLKGKGLLPPVGLARLDS
jgi:hypothetical protein